MRPLSIVFLQTVIFNTGCHLVSCPQFHFYTHTHTEKSDRLRMACKSRSISAITTQASSSTITYSAACIGLLSRNRIVCDRHLTDDTASHRPTQYSSRLCHQHQQRISNATILTVIPGMCPGSPAYYHHHHEQAPSWRAAVSTICFQCAPGAPTYKATKRPK